MTFSLFALFTALLSSALASAGEIGKRIETPLPVPCEERPLQFEHDFREWTSEVAKIAGHAALLQTPGDVRLGSGAVIDEACFTGLDAAAKKRMIQNLDRAINLAAYQSKRCSDFFELPEIANVSHQFSRLNLVCEGSEFVIPVGNDSIRRKFDSLGKNIGGRAPLYHSTFGIAPTSTGIRIGSIDTTSVKSGIYLVEIPKDLSLILDELPSVLFHEILHSDGHDNRTKHNSMNSVKISPCEEPRYRDRVYLMEKLCFAQQQGGLDSLSKFLGQCPDVCAKNFSEVDPNLIREREQLMGAPGFYARRYSPEDARATCDRLRERVAAESRVVSDEIQGGKALREFLAQTLGDLGIPKDEWGSMLLSIANHDPTRSGPTGVAAAELILSRCQPESCHDLKKRLGELYSNHRRQVDALQRSPLLFSW